MYLRDYKRYGRFSAIIDYNSQQKPCIVELSINGWTDSLKVFVDKKLLHEGELIIDDIDDDDGNMEELDDYFLIDGYIKVLKPFGKCLKRFR